MESKYINAIPERGAEVYHLSQGDSNRQIRCSLYEGAKAVKLSGTETLRMRYKKPDGSIGSIGVANTSNTYVDITIPDTIVDKKGLVYCKLKVNGIGCKAFYLSVEARP